MAATIPVRDAKIAVSSAAAIGSSWQEQRPALRLLNAGFQPFEMLCRQPDRSERRSSAFFVAVVIRPTRHQDAVTIGERQIVLRRRAIVLAVEGFNRRQAGL